MRRILLALAVVVSIPVFGVAAVIIGLEYDCWKRSSEARSTLIALCEAEHRYHAQTGSFTSDLRKLDLKFPDRPRYVYGFAVCSDEAEGACNTLAPRVGEARGFKTDRSVYVASWKPIEPDALLQLAPHATVSSAGFVAAAVGDLDTDSPGGLDLDVWTIDQSCEPVRQRSDC
jgi:hypothetical protein